MQDQSESIAKDGLYALRLTLQYGREFRTFHSCSEGSLLFVGGEYHVEVL